MNSLKWSADKTSFTWEAQASRIRRDACEVVAIRHGIRLCANTARPAYQAHKLLGGHRGWDGSRTRRSGRASRGR